MHSCFYIVILLLISPAFASLPPLSDLCVGDPLMGYEPIVPTNNRDELSSLIVICTYACWHIWIVWKTFRQGFPTIPVLIFSILNILLVISMISLFVILFLSGSISSAQCYFCLIDRPELLSNPSIYLGTTLLTGISIIGIIHRFIQHNTTSIVLSIIPSHIIVIGWIYYTGPDKSYIDQYCIDGQPETTAEEPLITIPSTPAQD